MAATEENDLGSLARPPTRRALLGDFNVISKAPPKEWPSRQTLVLLSMAHVMAGEASDAKIDWGVISKKLQFCVPPCFTTKEEWVYTAGECESRYLELMRVLPSCLGDNFSKREFLVKQITRGLIMDSQNRESSLLAKINSLAEQIRYVDSVPETESQFQQLQDISDGEEMSETEDGESKRLEKFLMSYSHFIDVHTTCFTVTNPVFDALPEDLTIDQFLQNFNGKGPSIHFSSGANIRDPDTTLSETLPEKIEHIQLKDTVPTTVSPQLSSLVRMAIRDAGEEDESSNKNMSPSAPTLSKLLELPPRDRNQPLPQINSLMTTTTESTESGDIFLNKTAINQDSPTKLLAALGTTTTPVIVNSSPTSKASLPGLVLKMPGSPLKSTDEMEIANDFVIESGLISSGTVELNETESQTIEMRNKRESSPVKLTSDTSTDSKPSIKNEDNLPANEVINPEGITKTDSEQIHKAIESETNSVSLSVPSVNLTPIKPKDEHGQKDAKTRLRQSTARMKLLQEEGGTEKEDTPEGKRITRARAKTSTSPSRSRTKSTGSVKGQGRGESESETSTETDTRPSRATRSRAVAATSPTSKASLPGLVLKMPGSPLKSTDEIEIANDFVIESGLISSGTAELNETESQTIEMRNKRESSPVKLTSDTSADSKPSIKDEDNLPANEVINPEGITKADSEQIHKAIENETNSVSMSVPSVNLTPIKTKNETGQKDAKTRLRQSTARMKLLQEGGTEKEDTPEGKRITRARAKTSTSPSRSRSRTKSIGSVKGQGKGESESETSTETDSRPSRATRSRAVAATPLTPSLLEAINPDSNPNSPAPSTPNNTKEVEELRHTKRTLLLLLARVELLKNCSMLFSKPLPDDTNSPGYYQKIKRPLDIPTIRRNIETGVTKNFPQLERDILLMFMNAIMVNHVTGIPASRVCTMISELHQECIAMFEDNRVIMSMPKLLPQITKKEASDVEPLEETKSKLSTPTKPQGRKRRKGSMSSSGNAEETPETKRRTLRTSTAAATTATAVWHSRKKINSSSPDISSGGRGRQE